MLSYNESISICAQQENPFVENKPYNPDHIIGFVVTHMLDGIAPSPGDSEAADYLKKLYITTIQVLMEKSMPVTEASIVQIRKEIEARMNTVAPVATEAESINAGSARAIAGFAPAPCYAADLKERVKFSMCSKSLTVKKQWIQWGVIALIILLLIKFLR